MPLLPRFSSCESRPLPPPPYSWDHESQGALAVFTGDHDHNYRHQLWRWRHRWDHPEASLGVFVVVNTYMNFGADPQPGGVAKNIQVALAPTAFHQLAQRRSKRKFAGNGKSDPITTKIFCFAKVCESVKRGRGAPTFSNYGHPLRGSSLVNIGLNPSAAPRRRRELSTEMPQLHPPLRAFFSRPTMRPLP